MGRLAEWSKANSPFLNMGDGETVTVEYLGYKMMQDRRDASKEKPVYKVALALPDGSGKVVKMFETSAGSVAKFFDTLSDDATGKAKKAGIMVKIVRNGEGTETKYKCVELDAAGQPVGGSEEDLGADLGDPHF